jgi:hypothetical protein
MGTDGVARRVTSRRRLLLTGAALALGAAMGRTGSAGALPLACAVPPREPPPFAPPDPAASWAAPSGPVVTTVTPSTAGYDYRVGGQPETIRGMGYNPTLTDADPDARRDRLDRDLALMAGAGVNTVVGWNPAVLDGLALDVAHRHGLGVALPFDVDFTVDVTQPAAREELTAAVLAWIDQYRQHPAVRLWAVGNEVLERSVPPAWCADRPSESQDAWATAWSSLLVDLADQIHARDPHHPVLYREAEDAYAPWLARALAARPCDRPWLVYGINAYTPRLGEMLDTWPARAIPSPLLVSEFAPPNAPRGERVDQLRAIWGVIRSRSPWVLGGAVYVWSTDGPEAVDRSFGLVDASGEPVDDALDAIAALYHADTGHADTGHANSGDGKRS